MQPKSQGWVCRLIPRPFLPPVFDHILYAKKTGGKRPGNEAMSLLMRIFCAHTSTAILEHEYCLWAQDCVVIPQGHPPWLHFVNEIAVPISHAVTPNTAGQWWGLTLLKMHPTRLTSKPAFFIQGDVVYCIFACSLVPSCLFSLARRHGQLSTRLLCMLGVSINDPFHSRYVTILCPKPHFKLCITLNVKQTFPVGSHTHK